MPYKYILNICHTKGIYTLRFGHQDCMCSIIYTYANIILHVYNNNNNNVLYNIPIIFILHLVDMEIHGQVLSILSQLDKVFKCVNYSDSCT